MVRDLLAEHGYSFRVWTHSEIYAEPRLANVGLILRYRCVDVRLPSAKRSGGRSSPELSRLCVQ